MSKTTSEYKLTASELPAIRELLKLQYYFGGGSAAIDDALILSMMDQLEATSLKAGALQNALFVQWSDGLYEALINVTTVYSQNFPALYLASRVLAFPFDPLTEDVNTNTRLGVKNVPRKQSCINTNSEEFASWLLWPGQIVCTDSTSYMIESSGIYPIFVKAGKLNYSYGGQYGPCPAYMKVNSWGLLPGSAQRIAWAGLPDAPAKWSETVKALYDSWGVTPPANVIIPSNFDQYEANLKKVLGTGSWTDVNNVRTAAAPVFEQEVTIFSTLVDASALTSESYFFFLHVLVFACYATKKEQQLASDLVNAVASSPEYPNDSFINQLFYLALMYLIDPFGSFAWTNEQLRSFMLETQEAVIGQDPASQMIVQSIDHSMKILKVDNTYPLHDPYAPGVGFNERMADTIQALDAARTQIAKAPTAREE